MAGEIRVTSGLQVLKRNTAGTLTLIDYQGRPQSFTADLAGESGPYGGVVAADDDDGVDVDLSGVASPGMCRFMNQDDTLSVRLGVWVPATGKFVPLFMLLPGETYVMRLDPEVGQVITGTGTVEAGDLATLRLIGVGGTVTVLVEVFPS